MKQFSKPTVIQMITGLDIGGIDGGRERYGLEVVRHLDHRQVNPVLCVFWRRGTPIEQAWVQRLEQEGTPYFFAAERSGSFSRAEFFRGVRCLSDFCTRQDGPVILHSHYQLGTLAGIGLRLRGQVQLLVRTVHTNAQEWERDRFGWLARLLLTDLLFPLGCDAEAGVSQTALDNLRRRLVRRVVRRPSALLYNGLPARRLTALVHPSTQPVPAFFQPGGVIIGSVGRLSKQKDYRTLVAALPHVLERIPAARLLLVGDGELREDLQAQAKALSIQGHVIFAGQQQDIDPYLAAMNLFVLPSLWEGLPTVLLESMAAGVPVVASDIPGNRDLVEEGVTGWLAPPADPIALAKVIVAVLTDAEGRASAVKAARQRAARFSMDIIAADHLALYRRLRPGLFPEEAPHA